MKELCKYRWHPVLESSNTGTVLENSDTKVNIYSRFLRWYIPKNNPRHPSTRNYVFYLFMFYFVELLASQI